MSKIKYKILNDTIRDRLIDEINNKVFNHICDIMTVELRSYIWGVSNKARMEVGVMVFAQVDNEIWSKTTRIDI